MKKLFQVFILSIINVVIFFPTLSSAAVYLPDTITVGNTEVYSAGDIATIKFTNSLKPVGKYSNIEYGVARTVEREGSTFYNPLSAEKKDLKGLNELLELPITIPNIFADPAGTTYVGYIKYFEQNNPDAENYFFTNKFKIKGDSATPSTIVKNINLFQSNGNRYTLTSGPTIYSPEYIKDYPEETLSTSTSIEVTFESNQTLTLNPVITLTRLRSDAFNQEIKAAPIAIKKGNTYAVIPLPTLNYEPGIYAGKLSFEGDQIKSIVEFQYIVGGDAVTVGNISIVGEKPNRLFNFDIFGVPVDLTRIPEGSTVTPSNTTYSVLTRFLDRKGKVIDSITEDVDFNYATFTRKIPSSLIFKNHVENIEVVVTSKSGKQVFSATKNVGYTNSARVALNAQNVLAIILILALIIFILRKRKKALVVVLILITILASGILLRNTVFSQAAPTTGQTEEEIQAATAAANALLDSSYQTYGYQPNGIAPYSTFWPSPVGKNGGGTNMPVGTWNDRNTQLFTQGYVPNYTFQCGKPYTVNYKFRANACNNDNTGVNVNIYFGPYDGRGVYEAYNHVGNKQHTGFQPEFGVGTLTAAPSIVAPHIIATTYQYLAWNQKSGYQVRLGGHWDYALQLKNNCSLIPEKCTCEGRTQVCTKAGLPFSKTPNSDSCKIAAVCSVSEVTPSSNEVTFTQTVTNAAGAVSFKGYSSSADVSAGTVDSTQNPITIPIKPGQTITRITEITDAFDNTSTKTECSASRPNPGPNSVACEGRDLVSKNAVNVEVDRVVNDPTCRLSATCTATQEASGNTLFTVVPKNAVGVASYKDVYLNQAMNSNTISVHVAQGTTAVKKVLVTDSHDGKTSEATCFYTKPVAPTVTTSCTCNADKSQTCSYSDGRAPTVTPNAQICNVASVCACSGRDYVCKANGQTVSTVNNADQCKFTASCEMTQVPGTRTVSVNHIVSNALGTVTYEKLSQLDGSKTGILINKSTAYTINVGESLAQKTLVTDTSDGSTATAQCNITDGTEAICSCSGTSQVCKARDGTITSQTRNSPQCSKSSQCSGTTLIQKNSDGREVGRILNSPQCGSECGCEGRDLVCRDGARNTESKRTVGAAQCKFTATCSGQVVGNNAVFTQVLTNALKGVTYEDMATGNPTNNPASEPIVFKQTVTKRTLITDTFDGSTAITLCSTKKVDSVEPKCGCEGRSMICRDSENKLINSNPRDTLCAFKATCNVEISDDKDTATFYYTYDNKLGNVTAKEKSTGRAFPSVLPLAAGGSIVRNVLLTDSDGSTSDTICVATRPGDSTNTNTNSNTNTNTNTDSSTIIDVTEIINTNTNTADTQVCTTAEPIILQFNVVPAVVRKGDTCNYVWSTLNFDRCSLKINGAAQNLGAKATAGPFIMFNKATSNDDRNQQALLTCEKDASVDGDAKTMTSSAVCSIIPEVIQR
ncbi:MAG: hypothetical protein V4576_03950 [Patescibacteria group bacterium]